MNQAALVHDRVVNTCGEYSSSTFIAGAIGNILQRQEPSSTHGSESEHETGALHCWPKRNPASSLSIVHRFVGPFRHQIFGNQVPYAGSDV